MNYEYTSLLSSNVIKNIQFVINLFILGVVLYNLIWAMPEQKRLYEECNIRVLCEMNEIDSDACDRKFTPNITFDPSKLPTS